MGEASFPLHQAVQRLDLPQVQHLARSDYVDAKDDDGHPPLWYAIDQLPKTTALNVASLLVSRGATVQLHTLFLCSTQDDDTALEILKILFNPLLNINEADTSTGLTLLHVLAGNHLNKCVSFVLQRGAHITKDGRGRTPGHYALQPNLMYEPLCKLHNIEVDQEMNNTNVVQITEVGTKVVHMLLQLAKRGMDLDDTDEDGQSLSNILGAL